MTTRKGWEDEICQECSRNYETWFVSNTIWNKVIPGRVAMLCADCFMKRATSVVRCTAWELIPENEGAGTVERALVGDDAPQKKGTSKP